MKNSTFKTFDFDFVNKKIKLGKKIRFDIGTSISAPVSRLWFNHLNDIYVIGIEPNPNCYDKENSWEGKIWNIKNEFENHPQGENYYHIIAACDDIDDVYDKQFYLLNGNVGCSSLLEPKIANLKGCSIDKIINVETFPMYKLLDNLNYELIELVKIDAQGKDLDIVKSFKNHIKNVCYLDVEDDSTAQYINAAKHEDIVEYISQNGFKLYTKPDGNLRFVNTTINLPKHYNNLTGDM